MNISLFSSLKEVFGGLLIGFLFGFLLNKAKVTHFKTIKKQLLLQDFTVMKVMLTAIATGSLGLYLYDKFIEHRQVIISTTSLKAAFVGGSIFGLGMAIVGLCPGTCIGALATKSKEAFYGFLGMVMGALLYGQVAIDVNKYFKNPGQIDKSTLDVLLNVHPIIIIGIVSLAVLGLFFFERKIIYKKLQKN